MFKLFPLVVCMALVILNFGCASRGFNRGALRESIDQKPVITDAEIAKAMALKPQLPKPFKIAIHFSDPSAERYERAGWRWTETEKEKIVNLSAALKATKQVSDVYIMNEDVTHIARTSASSQGTESPLKVLRLAAARHGADALLIISGTKAIDSYANAWAWTYVALVPMLFVPGTQTDALFLARASLWDVRNEFLYMSAEGESVQKQTAPAMLGDEKALVEQAKVDAVDKLSNEISSQIKSLTLAKVSRR